LLAQPDKAALRADADFFKDDEEEEDVGEEEEESTMSPVKQTVSDDIMTSGTSMTSYADQRKKVEEHETRQTEIKCKNKARKEAADRKKIRMAAKEMQAWYQRTHAALLPRYVPPLEHLVREMPDLFDPATGEATVSKKDKSLWPVACPQCNETPSPSGWGTPGCPSCSGVEELCFPISEHLFGSLLRTPKRDLPGLSTELPVVFESEDVDINPSRRSSLGGSSAVY